MVVRLCDGLFDVSYYFHKREEEYSQGDFPVLLPLMYLLPVEFEFPFLLNKFPFKRKRKWF
jgi:hypothetical protein